jgi:hypothetical protein
MFSQSGIENPSLHMVVCQTAIFDALSYHDNVMPYIFVLHDIDSHDGPFILGG